MTHKWISVDARRVYCSADRNSRVTPIIASTLSSCKINPPPSLSVSLRVRDFLARWEYGRYSGDNGISIAKIIVAHYGITRFRPRSAGIILPVSLQLTHYRCHLMWRFGFILWRPICRCSSINSSLAVRKNVCL